MNTKDLDAIKQMGAQLQNIKETNWLVLPTVYNISAAMECLQEVIGTYDSKSNNPSQIRTD